jgi:hypothetical protein
MILIVIMERISKAATVLSVYTILCHDRGYINVMFVLQSCTDPLHIPPASSSDTHGTLSDCAYHVGIMNVEEELDMQEAGEVNVEAEKGIGSEEEECVGIKDEQGLYSEEDEEEKDIITKEEEDVDIKEEVSLEDTV